jgi:hypothetical protein
MKPKRPFIATLKDVKIKRDSDGETAIITYRDKSVGTVHFKIGPQITKMSEEEILYHHNQCIYAQLESRKNYHHNAREIPPGKPQIEYSKCCCQLVPRGDVLRCEVSDGGKNGEATFWIDDQELSLQEFGRMMTVWAGWGVRIICVPDDELYHNPPIKLCEPETDETASIMLDLSFCPKNEH